MGPHSATLGTRPTAALQSSELWAGVDRVVERMDLDTILAHRLAPLAAEVWSESGRTLPEVLAHQRRAAQLIPLLVVAVLARAREAYSGRMLVVKGPEIAALYRVGDRPYWDLDVLVDDAPAALEALLAAGFETLDEGTEQRPHHLPPVWWPGVHLPLEIHTHLNWPRHLQAPPNDELFEQAVPSSVPVDGLETAAPAHHTILTAAHCWKHLPLRSVRDLIDVAILAEQSDPDELERVARSWQMDRIWHTMAATSEWLFAGGRRPVATRLWAQSLRRPREATILERHVRRWVTPFWALPPGRAAVAAAKNIAADLQPVDGEGWGPKLRRSILVASHPAQTHSARAREDEEEF